MKLRSLILAGFLALPLTSSYAQVDVSVNFAPPPLPVYEQPPCPVAGYIWTPGYWGWGEMSGIITGCRVSGSLRRQWVCFGHRHGGAGTTAYTRLTRVTGDQLSAFMEALITVMATPEMATGAADGVETTSSTTPL